MRVVLIKGASGYGALGLFADALAGAFARRGFSPVIVDTTVEPDLARALQRVAAEGPVALAFSFGLFGEFRSHEGLSVAELVEAPHVIQYVDYPLTHALRLDRTPRSTAILVVDESHVDAITATYGPDHFAHVGFCPHAAVGEPVPLPDRPDAFAAERPIPLLFAGTFYRPGRPVWRDFPDPIGPLFDAALEIALASEWVPALEALRQALAAHGLDLYAPDLNSVRRAATFVHEQVREHRRLQLLEALARAGVPLVALGRGWAPELQRFGKVDWRGEAELGDVLRLMGRTRVVLSVNANFGAGSHERPLSALVAGAAAATDHSRYWSREFEAGEEILLYRWSALDEGVDAIARLVAEPSAAHAMARAGQARVMAGRRFDHRVDAILAAAEAARPALTLRPPARSQSLTQPLALAR